MKIATLATALLAAMAASAAEIHKAANTDSLDQPSSWEEGVVPGPTDTVVWNVTGHSAKTTVRLGENQNFAVSGFSMSACSAPSSGSAATTVLSSSCAE